MLLNVKCHWNQCLLNNNNNIPNSISTGPAIFARLMVMSTMPSVVSGSGISWAICKSAPSSRQITMPAPQCSVFFTGRMPFLPPNQQCQTTLKALVSNKNCKNVISTLLFSLRNAANKLVVHATNAGDGCSLIGTASNCSRWAGGRQPTGTCSLWTGGESVRRNFERLVQRLDVSIVIAEHRRENAAPAGPDVLINPTQQALVEAFQLLHVSAQFTATVYRVTGTDHIREKGNAKSVHTSS